MQTNTRVRELEAGYKAVFDQVRENGLQIRGMKVHKNLWLQQRRLNDCLERLDRCAENLEQLDRDLGEIARVDENFERRLTEMPRYSALLNLGTAVYNVLYTDYQELRKLREIATLLLLAAVAGAVVLAAVLVLVL